MIIAISGKSGCGNSTVSALVAERLGLTLINYTFRTLAKDLGMSFWDLSTLAEQDQKYDRMVDNKQIELAKQGNCVLGSRLSVWMVKQADLKVYLTAKPEVRASRIHQREGGIHTDKLTETISRDKRDHERYLKLYNIDNDDFGFVDLVIDAGEKDQYQIADLICEKAKNMEQKSK